MTLEELTARFADAALIQYDALLDNDIRKNNQVYGRLVEVREELRRRGPEARLALTALFNHKNVQVRLQAARFAMAVAPMRARKLLQDIKDSQDFPQAGDAGMALYYLDSGTWVPD